MTIEKEGSGPGGIRGEEGGTMMGHDVTGGVDPRSAG
jgi:hypothetical protein